MHLKKEDSKYKNDKFLEDRETKIMLKKLTECIFLRNASEL